MPPVSRRATATTDIRDRPAYPVAEAARYVKVPAATLRSWVVGREYETTSGTRHFPALVTPASREPLALSFYNLVEAHVLRALRTTHSVSIPKVRTAIRVAEQELGLARLLLRKELCTSARQLFLDTYGQLIELSPSGQLAMREMLQAYLSRIEWDRHKFPVRLYPFITREHSSADQPIVIDPAIGFGRPIIQKRAIATATIAQRIDAGETVAELAEDYDLTAADIEQAVLYERAA